MTSKTETAFNPEGNRDRLQYLLSDYKRLQTKRGTEKIPEKTSLVFEMGEELLKLKKSLGFENFIKTIESVGILRSVAQEYMMVVQKLGSYRDVVKDIEVSKLFILTHCKNEFLEILMEGGAISGATLTDIGKISKRRVRYLLQTKRSSYRITWHRRLSVFRKHIKLAFSALVGGNR